MTDKKQITSVSLTKIGDVEHWILENDQSPNKHILVPHEVFKRVDVHDELINLLTDAHPFVKDDALRLRIGNTVVRG